MNTKNIKNLHMTVILSQNLEGIWFIHVRRGGVSIADWEAAARWMTEHGQRAPWRLLYEAKYGVSGLYPRGAWTAEEHNTAVLKSALHADFEVQDSFRIYPIGGQIHVMSVSDVPDGAAFILGEIGFTPYWYDDGENFLLNPVSPTSIDVIVRVPISTNDEQSALQSARELLHNLFPEDLANELNACIDDVQLRPDHVRRYVRALVHPEQFPGLTGVRRVKIGCTPVYIKRVSPPEEVCAEFDSVQKHGIWGVEYVVVPLPYQWDEWRDGFLARRRGRYYVALRDYSTQDNSDDQHRDEELQELDL